ERRTAFATELGPWVCVHPALRAASPQGDATLDTKLGAGWMVTATAGAAHGRPLLHLDTCGWIMPEGGAPPDALLMCVRRMARLYSSPRLVSSEKHQRAREAFLRVRGELPARRQRGQRREIDAIRDRGSL